MGAGPRNPEVDAPGGNPPWARATLAWMLMMLAETGQGYAREVFIAPVTGALRARQLGVLTGSVVVLLIAWACARWMGAVTRRSQFAVGAYWVTLTLCFEFAVGRAMKLGWDRLLADYDPTQGGFMLAGLAVMFAAPWVAWRLR